MMHEFSKMQQNKKNKQIWGFLVKDKQIRKKL